MNNAAIWLDLVLIALLAATLFHALRLERALGVLKQDRAALEQLVAGFNGATSQAEAGVERLRGAADGVGRQIARQIETAKGLRDDLQFLSERGEKLADRLEGLVRNKPSEPAVHSPPPPASFAPPAAVAPPASFAQPASFGPGPAEYVPEPAAPRVRSQAERDLILALRTAR
jgi:hypothetical protein